MTISGVSVPAFTTRRADTTVELGDGESFVIGGLIDRETASNVTKVPLLGDLPIIGTFFKHLNTRRTRSELVIIVTPHLVSPLAKGATLPSTPGEQSEQRNGPVWRSLIGGVASRDAVAGIFEVRPRGAARRAGWIRVSSRRACELRACAGRAVRRGGFAADAARGCPT